MMSTTAYTDLRSLLADLGDDLLTVTAELDPRHEIAALLAASQHDGRVVLCTQVKGYPGARVVGNLMASRRVLARALGTTEAGLAATYMASKEQSRPTVAYRGAAPVKEVVHRAPEEVAALLPVLTHHAADAGAFITSGLVIARDPDSGRRAMGIHRMMLQGGNRLGVFLANPPLSLYHANAERRGEPLEVAVALGVEPATLLAAVVKLGAVGPDKLEIAGGLRGRPLELVPGETVAVDLPAHAEIVIEGRVLPGVRADEGPFGENTGYYFSNSSPVIEVSAITHRRDFIYPALCPWTLDVDNLLSLAGGTELLWQLHGQMHGIVDLELVAGTCGFTAVIAVHDLKPVEVRRVIMLALSLDKRLKLVTVVDDEVDIRDQREVAWALATRCQPDRDTVVYGGTEAYVIDPSATAAGSGSKIGFDATRGSGAQFDRITLPQAARERAAAVLAESVR